MHLMTTLISLALLAAGGWYVWNEYPQVQQFITAQMPSHEVLTLEARYNADQIMEAQKQTLLKDNQYTFLAPTFELHPYLLMQIKYVKNSHQTAEGMLLWSLENGEMVIDASSWEHTHGFCDALVEHADRNDFKILFALAKKGGQMDRQSLLSELHADPDQIDSWLDNCRKKHLVVQLGNTFRLHFDKPKFVSEPVTRLGAPLVQKTKVGAQTIFKRYSASQITDMAQAAFGQDFVIRSADEVYLPVYLITVQNPDGSQRSTRWNALTGKLF